jgi:outer membrane protein OmpA-like peptidoglycan-associated protein
LYRSCYKEQGGIEENHAGCFYKELIMQLGLSKRWQRRALFFVLGVLLLWGGSWVAVPRLVQWQLEKQGTRLLGRAVTVEQVVFRPWSMALILRGLHMARAGSQDAESADPLTVDEVEVNVALQSLVFLAPVADAIVLRNPQVHVTHLGQGRYDIDDVLQRFTTPGDASTGMPRMSLFNIQIVGGGVRFRDAPQSVTHVLSDVRLDIPFLSNLGARRDVATHPRLAFKFNGAVFDTDAETTPFAKDRHTQARFKIKDLDVAPYLPYWPAAWPVRLAQGTLAMDVTVDFRQQAAAQLALSGHVRLDRFLLHEKTRASTEQPLLQWGGLDLKIEEWRPLDAVFKLDSVLLERPVVHVRRDHDGALNWTGLQRFFAPPVQSEPSPPNQTSIYALKDLHIAAGQVQWQDAMTRVPTTLVWADVDVQSSHLSWPAREVARLKGQASLQGARVSWRGETDGKSAQLGVKWTGLSLKTTAAYWAELFLPELAGQSSADLELVWRAAEGVQPPQLVLTAPQVRFTDVRLGQAGQPDAWLAELALDQVEVDVFQQQVRLGRVALTRPQLKLSRSPEGRWMTQDWWVPTKPQVAKAGPASTPWQLDVRQLQIGAGVVNLDDRSAGRPVQMAVRELNLLTGPWQPLAESPPMTSVKLDLLAGAARRDAGRLGFDGAFRLPSVGLEPAKATPLQLKGRLQLDHFPVHPLSPYGAERVHFDLKRADLSYAGALDLALPEAGLGLNLQGHMALENLRATMPPDSDDLLNVKSLNVRGLDLGLQSGALVRLKIDETTLSDFFARVAIDPEGQLNWQRLLKSSPAKDAKPPQAKAVVDLGPMGMVNGRVLFSDHFIQPNYSADLTALTGRLGAFSNRHESAQTASLAELSLRGQVAGSGSLEIQGHMNPLARPVALDVRGQVRDLELPQFSPYSHKYAGYGIERGKLSAQVNYRIDADAQLQATHKIILNQLRFGERSNSADAPDLPVKLAVALLADSQGVIDINLPVTGSINDPDFRVGAIVWKMVLKLIGKAILSPFSLIAGAFSEEDRLEQLNFLPGSAELDAANRTKLKAVAQWLSDKAALRVTLVGQADLDAEREAFRQAELLDLVKAEKRRRLSRDNQDASKASAISPEEYPSLLTSVYRRSAVPKPRNALGWVKDLPPAEMEALLLAALSVDASDMRDLAQARAQHVREALMALKVPEAQLFLGAPEVSEAARTAPFVPQVKLVVSTD